MTKTIATTEDMVIEVEATIKEFRNQYEKWQEHQAVSDNMLYALLEGCLDFYYFLRSEEDYESAFKSTCYFKWNAKTKLHTLIVKAIFGDDNKMSYAYAKAIKKAIEENVKAEKNEMQTWLRINGGINGVIRSEKSNKGSIEREYLIQLGRNFELFGRKSKIKPFKNDDILRMANNSELLIVVSIDRETSNVILKSVTNDEDFINSAHAHLGKAIYESENYKTHKEKADKIMLENKQKASEEVNTKLKNIMGKMKIEPKQLSKVESSAENDYALSS